MNEKATTERILIVEDEEAVLRLLERVLGGAGYTELRSVSDARHVLPTFREWQPDLVVMDIGLAHMDGIAVMQQLRSRLAPDEFLPILLVTGDVAPETKQRALAAGASDFLQKPFEFHEVLVRIRHMLELRGVQRELREGRERAERQVQRSELEMVRRLTAAARFRNPEGSDPALVGELSGRIARSMSLADKDVDEIRLTAPLHDVGMIGISDELLSKQGSLSLEELDQIRAHTSIGARILANSDSRLLQLAEEIALYHHECWDGSGYTPGLSGPSIPIAARIVAVAETFCAMTSDRPYRSARSVEDAVSWIESQSGLRYDPDVVGAFMRVVAMEGLPLLQAQSSE
ncbi:MAG: HD domain-containing phosphohydrolase [Gemmatimonadota bacterium]